MAEINLGRQHESDCEQPTVKGTWSREEDEILLKLVRKMGPRDWKAISAAGLPQRTSKSCRLRWYNHLSPQVITLLNSKIGEFM